MENVICKTIKQKNNEKYSIVFTYYNIKKPSLFITFSRRQYSSQPYAYAPFLRG